MLWPASVTGRPEAASPSDGSKPAVSIRWLKASSTHLLSPDMAPILPSRISLLYPDVCRGVRRSLLWNDIHATQKPVSVSIARCLPGANRSSCILKAQSRAFSITTSVDVRDDDFRSLDLNLGAISEQDRRDAVLEVGLLRLVARLKALVGLGTYLLTFSLGYLYTWTY